MQLKDETMFRIIFLRLIHYAIALGEFAFGIYKTIPYFHHFLPQKQIAGTKIEADAKTLRKLPLHVGLLVVENEFSLQDLANIIIWSVTMGISYISLYDMNGKLHAVWC